MNCVQIVVIQGKIMANKPTEKEILNSLQDLYDILVQLIEKGIVVKSDEYLNMRLKIARKILQYSRRVE